MTNRRLGLFFVFAAVLLLNSPRSAFAHPGHLGDFHAGWQHPLTGLDHLLAMVAVGLLAARVGGRGLWLFPTVFLGAMLVGGVAASAGLQLPGVEFGIMASVLVLGLLIASASAAPLWFATALVAVFAVVHGHAHTTEMVAQGSFTTYASGYLLATTGLLAAGVLGGVALAELRQTGAIRLIGGTIAVLGSLLIVGWL